MGNLSPTRKIVIERPSKCLQNFLNWEGNIAYFYIFGSNFVNVTFKNQLLLGMAKLAQRNEKMAKESLSQKDTSAK